MPGGFHPFHAGHAALYDSARKAFPSAEVFVAATNDTSNRPFPFAIKEKLAKLAGVQPGHFVQVKSPFRAEEITARFDPNKDRLIFVRSEKDADKPPQAGGVKRDGSPAYLQPLAGQTNIRPFKEHAYMAYLPTVEFGPGMTSATEIRNAWPKLNEKRKTALVMSLYPQTQQNPKLAANVVAMLDTAIGSELAESNMLGSVMFRSKPPKLKKIQPAVSRTKDFMKKDFSLSEGLDDDESVLNHFAEVIADEFGYDPDEVMDSIVDEMVTPSGVPVYTFTDDDQTYYMGVLQRGKGSALVSVSYAGGGQDNELEIYGPGENLKYVVKYGRTTPTLHTPDNKVIAQAKPGQDENDMVGIALDMLWGKMQQRYTTKENQGWAATFTNETDAQNFVGGMTAGYQDRENQPVDEDYIEEKWSQKYKSSINCSNPKGFSQRAHCQGRKK